ncbi:MAG: Gfo/Idh/MocA family oxidoreductase [Anaerolineae bacterium]
MSRSEQPLRAVLVGCGGMSRAWLDAARAISDLQIVGLVDVVETAAYHRAAEYNLVHATIGADLTTVLDATAPDIVFDVTVPEAHTTVTLTALARGCHVLGEKPLADSMENARRMVAAAQAAGRLLAVIQNRRYNAEIRRLRHFLASGALGPLTTIACDFYVGPHFGGFRDAMAHPLLLDMAIHTFDAARFLTGADPVSVYCKEWNPAGSWYAHGASAVAIFEMTGGIVFTYRGSWCAEGLPTSWEAAWRVIGPRGTATWDGYENIAAEVVAATGGFVSRSEEVLVPTLPREHRTHGHADIIREFVACVRDGGTPETVCTDNIKSLAMVFGAIESAEQGRPAPIAVEVA